MHARARRFKIFPFANETVIYLYIHQVHCYFDKRAFGNTINALYPWVFEETNAFILSNGSSADIAILLYYSYGLYYTYYCCIRKRAQDFSSVRAFIHYAN